MPFLNIEAVTRISSNDEPNARRSRRDTAARPHRALGGARGRDSVFRGTLLQVRIAHSAPRHHSGSLDMAPSGIQVVLPDGSKKALPAGATGADLAKAIGPGRAKAALDIRVNGDVPDPPRPLPDGRQVSILTNKDPQALRVLRQSSAHVLATAVRQIFPKAQIGFGPPIEDGFYYDFDIGRPFTPEDLQAIELKMAEVTNADYPFVREEVSREEAKKRFVDDPLKLERIGDLGPNETISVYTDGPFVDLCRGPHVPSTGKIQHFKLLHAAGAYWRGDERRQMLQRIYGTAWFSKQDLDQYITRLEEARKRDHRVIGRQ